MEIRGAWQDPQSWGEDQPILIICSNKEHKLLENNVKHDRFSHLQHVTMILRVSIRSILVTKIRDIEAPNTIRK